MRGSNFSCYVRGDTTCLWIAMLPCVIVVEMFLKQAFLFGVDSEKNRTGTLPMPRGVGKSLAVKSLIRRHCCCIRGHRRHRQSAVSVWPIDGWRSTFLFFVKSNGCMKCVRGVCVAIKKRRLVSWSNTRNPVNIWRHCDGWWQCTRSVVDSFRFSLSFGVIMRTINAKSRVVNVNTTKKSFGEEHVSARRPTKIRFLNYVFRDDEMSVVRVADERYEGRTHTCRLGINRCR